MKEFYRSECPDIRFTDGHMSWLKFGECLVLFHVFINTLAFAKVV